MTRHLTLALALFFFAAPASAAEPKVDEIIQKTNLASYYAGEDGRARVKMTITDSQGRARTRIFTVLRKDTVDGGEQKFYIHFHEPADVAKMTFIVHKYMDREDDRWLYLPDLDLEKRIAAADKRTSFVGSDFFYEDISGRSLDEDVHELLRTTDSYYVLKHTPKKPGSVEFGHYTMHVDKRTFLPMRVEFFDKSGQKYRVMAVEKVKMIQGHPTVLRATMENTKTGSKTTIAYGGIRYDIGLPDKVFGKRYLKRAPVKYLRK